MVTKVVNFGPMPAILFCIMLCDDCRDAMVAQARVDYYAAEGIVEAEGQALELIQTSIPANKSLVAEVRKRLNLAYQKAHAISRWRLALHRVNRAAMPPR